MAVEIIDYFDSNDRKNWIRQIERGDWEAAKYLGKLLSEDKLKDLCGESTKLLLLVENKNLYSFCTLAEQDEVRAPDMTPWVGFIYTFPEYRRNHYATRLIEHACHFAKKSGAREVYSSSAYEVSEFYEKLGFSMIDYPMPTIYGYDTYVFHKEL